MQTKLKIKMGNIEFEYEGDAEYNSEAVKDLFSHIESLMGSVYPKTFDSVATPAANDGEALVGDAADGLAELGMNTVAARLDVKSGPDLAMAAAAHIQICLGKTFITRRDLLSTMQAATNYYNVGMNKNLTHSLKGLVSSKRLNSLAENKMSLPAAEVSQMRGKLAQS